MTGNSKIDDLNDESLMLNYAEKDCIKSFTILFDRHNQNMIGYVIYRFNYHQETAQDIVSTVWEKVIRSKSAYRPTAKFKTYLYRILHNTQVDYFRKNKGHHQHYEEDEISVLVNNKPSYISEIITLEAYRNLYQAINSLSENYAVVITLYYMEGFKVREIAEIIQESHECTKSRLRYAKKAIRKHLENNNMDSNTVRSYLQEFETDFV